MAETSAATNKRRHMPRPLKITLIVVAAVIATAATVIAAAALMLRVLLPPGIEEPSYFEIGQDKVPTIRQALGDSASRKVTETRTSANAINGIVESIEYKYSDKWSRPEGQVLFDYANYLSGEAGFSLLDEGYGSMEEHFDHYRHTGGGAKLTRDSEDAGYIIVVQLNWSRVRYDTINYTVTLTRVG
jgi:hypothetical protein